eukprot:13084-Prymnesium_polylepis.1
MVALCTGKRRKTCAQRAPASKSVVFMRQCSNSDALGGANCRQRGSTHASTRGHSDRLPAHKVAVTTAGVWGQVESGPHLQQIRDQLRLSGQDACRMRERAGRPRQQCEGHAQRTSRRLGLGSRRRRR